MAPEVMIHAEDLGKHYQIGERAPYRALRDSVARTLKRPAYALLRRGRPLPLASRESIWALRNVSFDVRRGEVVGLIGRNGAGKSTLLKILSRITQPTEGHAEIRGQVRPLLEVGTGFHPELTGRDNIYFNGAILGMRKAEIRRKFDEIVSFAEVEQFIDTPVKFYSSGMYVRLAFSVAAHLEPDVLLVDEVLAVGDAAFQKRCLGKMGDVAKEGRTILFVSHNMNAVTLLCSRAILLEKGQVQRDGPAAEVVGDYLTGGFESTGEVVWDDPATAPGNERVRLRAVRIIQDGKTTADVELQKDVVVEVEFANYKPGAYLSTSIHLLDHMGGTVLCGVNHRSTSLTPDPWCESEYPLGIFRTRCTLPGNLLNEGRYGVRAFIRADMTRQEIPDPPITWFTVHDPIGIPEEYASFGSSAWAGVVRPRLGWETSLVHDLSAEPVGSR